jgi:hypothetical protein
MRRWFVDFKIRNGNPLSMCLVLLLRTEKRPLLFLKPVAMIMKRASVQVQEQFTARKV